MKLTLEEFNATPWTDVYSYILQVAVLDVEHVFWNKIREEQRIVLKPEHSRIYNSKVARLFYQF